MTPAETNRQIALRVMGWHEWNGIDDYDGPLLMFYDWKHPSGGLAVYEDTENVRFYFNPSHDERDCMRALEKMHYWIAVQTTLRDNTKMYSVRVISTPNGNGETGTGPTFCAAACDAMKLATEGE